MRIVKLALIAFMALSACLCGAAEAQSQKDAKKEKLPLLLDFGARECIPCKKLAPILEELKTEYSGVMDVEFVDVWMKENVKRAEEWRIQGIPTQIFISAEGKELSRHEGFIEKKAIVERWKELGIDLEALKKAKGK